MADLAISKKKIPPKPQPVQVQKKKKKNAPDAPQPKWLFPPDEENPVLNPKAKTSDQIQQENDEREKSLNYMERRIHAAPDRPAPPPELLTLVGIFLTDFGFNSTSRLFTNEREARKVLNGWKDTIGSKIEKGTPTLEQIYRDWYRDWKTKKLANDETSSDETSSSGSGSDSGDSDNEAGVATQVNGVNSGGEDSETGSDSLSVSDRAVKSTSKTKARKAKAVKKPSGSSSSSSTSDSDADDEDEKKQPRTKSAAATKTTKLRLETTATPSNRLKRKVESSSSEESGSDSSASTDDERPAKKTKISTTTIAAVARLTSDVPDSPFKEDEGADGSKAEKTSHIGHSKAETSSESSSSESSDSEQSSQEETKAKRIVNGAPLIPKASSDSSATINGDVRPAGTFSPSTETSSSAPSASESDAMTTKLPVTKEKKHTGAKPTPLAELSAKGIQDHISNHYQSYEYADRAYQDLSVTRGKGFTKEKNKKKRGSYRGGAIDISGGKGFKFDN